MLCVPILCATATVKGGGRVHDAGSQSDAVRVVIVAICVAKCIDKVSASRNLSIAQVLFQNLIKMLFLPK